MKNVYENNDSWKEKKMHAYESDLLLYNNDEPKETGSV